MWNQNPLVFVVMVGILIQQWYQYNTTKTASIRGIELKMNSGFMMPAVGLGTWQSVEGDVGIATMSALKIGYRHIDTANMYGNEKEIGAVLSDLPNGLEREDLFITSKLPNTHHAPTDVELSLNESLEALNTTYLDLYLMHWPVAVRTGSGFPPRPSDIYPESELSVLDTWRAMEALVESGRVRSIGVSNFGAKRLGRLLKAATIVPAVNQIERHPYLQQPDLAALCRKEGIIITAYSPLGSPGRPARHVREVDPVVLSDTEVQAVAEAHQKSPAQVLLAWALRHGTAVIPKSTKPHRLAENIGALALAGDLTEDDMKRLDALEKGYRYIRGEYFYGSLSSDEFWA